MTKLNDPYHAIIARSQDAARRPVVTAATLRESDPGAHLAVWDVLRLTVTMGKSTRWLERQYASGLNIYRQVRPHFAPSSNEDLLAQFTAEHEAHRRWNGNGNGNGNAPVPGPFSMKFLPALDYPGLDAVSPACPMAFC
jgi:hypothetical protein